jgi:hypothetical protein
MAKLTGQGRLVVHPPIAILLGALLSMLGGCLASSETAHYLVSQWGGDRASKPIRMSCGRGYTVIEKGSQLLVQAYSLTEFMRRGRNCPLEFSASPMAAGVRYGGAADEYLRQKVTRSCRVTGGRELTQLHSEFTFSCV